MVYLDRYTGGVESGAANVSSRRQVLIEQVRQRTPISLERAVNTGNTGEEDEAPGVALEWVKVYGPRPGLNYPVQIEVRPVLEVGWVSDGSGFGSVGGVTQLKLEGKLPGGEIHTIGSMTMPSEFDLYDEYDPGADIDNDEEAHYSLAVNLSGNDLVGVNWFSTDAWVWLKLAEDAIAAQP